MLRVALYIRVSTDEQAIHGESIATQRDALTFYAKSNNMNIIDYYIDEGYTATNLKRPNLQRLLNDIKENKIDMVLFTKIDRWSRGVRNYYKIQDILDSHKVNWKTIFEDYDTSTASGRLHINIMLSVAENESAQTSERIKAVFKNKLSKGEVCSGKIPRGYKIENKKLVVDPEVAPMIQDIFNYYESVNSLNKLVDYVKNNYYHIHQLTLKRILTNTLYKGTHTSEYAVTENYCEAIISETQFDNVQRLLTINQKKYNNKFSDSIYLFSGLLICKECEHKLVGNRQIKENKTRGKYIYKVYKCQNHFKEHVCPNNYNIPEENILEKYLVDNIQSELKKYIIQYNRENSKKTYINLSNKKGALKRKLERLKDLYIDELIDKETYKNDYEKLTNELNKLKEENKNKIIPFNKNKIDEILNVNLKEDYYKLSENARRSFWTSIIDKIIKGNNRNYITIHFL